MVKVAMIFPGTLPVPPTRGGAVENLIYNIMKVNEKDRKMSILSYSLYDDLAKKKGSEFSYTKFKFFNVPFYVRLIDRLVYFFMGIIGKKNIHTYRYLAHRLFYLYQVAKDVHKRDDIDLIILENHITTCLVMKLFGNSKKFKGRFIYHAHNEINGWFGMKNEFFRIGKYLCVSNYIKKTIREKGINDWQISVLANAVNTSRFQNFISVNEKNKIKRKYGISATDKIILFAGRIIPEKGVKEAILGFMEADIPNTKLLIVGGAFFERDVKNSYERELVDIINDMRGRVVLVGYVSYEKMPKIYQIADLGLFPSIWDEPALLTGIEARCSGLPIITTDAGGIPEYIHEEFGIVLKRDKDLVHNISKSIKELLEDNERCNLMKKMAIRYSNNFDEQTYYCDFYRNIMIK